MLNNLLIVVTHGEVSWASHFAHAAQPGFVLDRMLPTAASTH